MSDVPQDPTDLPKDQICLECKSVTMKKKAIVEVVEDDSDGHLVSKCPVCYEEKSLFKLRDLVELDSFKEYLDKLESR